MKGSVILSLWGLSLAALLCCRVSAADPAEMMMDEDAILTLLGSGGTDLTPNGFGVLSSGSFVFFQDSSGAGHSVMDALILCATGDGTGAASVIVSAADIAAALGVTPAVAPSHTVQCRGLEVGSNDDVYLYLADYTETMVAGSRSTNILRVPNSGGDSFASPVLLADATRLGQVDDGAAYRLAIDTGTTPDTLIFGVDNEAVADDASTNGIFSLISTANNDTDPTRIGYLDQVAIAAGGTSTVDKGSCADLTVAPEGDVIINDGRSTSAHKGNIVRMNRSTGVCSLLVDRDVSETTGQTCCLSYNSTNGKLGVFWHRATTQDGGLLDDRLEERNVASGTLTETLIYRNQLVILNPDNSADSSFQLGDASYNFANTGNDYFVFSSHGTTGAEEAIYRIAASVPPPTPTPSSGVEAWPEYR